MRGILCGRPTCVPVSCLTFKSEEESRPGKTWSVAWREFGFLFWASPPPSLSEKRLNRWFVDVVWDVEVCRYNTMPCMRQKKGEGLPAALKKKKTWNFFHFSLLSPSCLEWCHLECGESRGVALWVGLARRVCIAWGLWEEEDGREELSCWSDSLQDTDSTVLIFIFMCICRILLLGSLNM